MSQQNIPSSDGDYASVNGIKLYYEVHGEGPPLLFLHGGSVLLDVWREHLPELTQQYTVILVDSRGHGRSTDNEEPYSYQLMAKDIVELLKHLKIDNAYIVGWSDGSIIGLTLALFHPEVVKKLMIIGGLYHTDGYTQESWEMMQQSTADTWFPETKAMYEYASSTPAEWPRFFNRLKEMWLSSPKYTKDQLKSISIPVSLIMGTHDEFVRPEHAKSFAESILNCQLTWVEDAVHNLPVDQVSLIDDIIKKTFV